MEVTSLLIVLFLIIYSGQILLLSRVSRLEKLYKLNKMDNQVPEMVDELKIRDWPKEVELRVNNKTICKFENSGKYAEFRSIEECTMMGTHAEGDTLVVEFHTSNQ
jgi:hypothetical protein